MYHSCKTHGRVTEFYTWSNGKTACKLCHRAKGKRGYDNEDLEKRRARCTRWVKRNPEQKAESDAKCAANRKAKAPDKFRSQSAARMRRWRAAHPEEARERGKASARKYRELHPEEASKFTRDWCRAHPEKVKEYKQRRRAAKARVVNDLTAEQWQKIVASYDSRCAYCTKKLKNPHQEHVIPITQGGGHTMSNVVPCCPHCNSKKGTSTWKPLSPAYVRCGDDA